MLSIRLCTVLIIVSNVSSQQEPKIDDDGLNLRMNLKSRRGTSTQAVATSTQ